MNISDILKKYEHLNVDTDKNTTHGYVDYFYNQEFKRFKNKKISLCEIGIYFGASLSLWDKYFTDAKILGIDNQNMILEKYYPDYSDNVNYVFYDAYDKNFAESLKNFDIIIDDGPHTLESQKLFIKYYLPKLNDNGILIIEDIQDYSWFDELIKETPEEYRKNIDCIDLRNIKSRYDDMIFVIRK